MNKNLITTYYDLKTQFHNLRSILLSSIKFKYENITIMAEEFHKSVFNSYKDNNHEYLLFYNAIFYSFMGFEKFLNIDDTVREKQKTIIRMDDNILYTLPNLTVLDKLIQSSFLISFIMNFNVGSIPIEFDNDMVYNFSRGNENIKTNMMFLIISPILVNYFYKKIKESMLITSYLNIGLRPAYIVDCLKLYFDNSLITEATYKSYILQLKFQLRHCFPKINKIK